MSWQQLHLRLVAVVVAVALPHCTFASGDSSVKALVHADGVDASTTFTDSSSNRSITATGNAQVDTAQSKFGGASILLDGSGDYLNMADSDDFYFGTADFTIDMWIRTTSAGTTGTIFDHSQNPTSGPYFNLSKYSTNALEFNWYHTSASCNVFATGITWVADTWHHVAVVKYSGTVTLYVDGISKGTGTGCPNYNDTSDFQIGGSGYRADFNGWIDEFRISKGEAKWTSNFTPPTEAYLNAGITLTETAMVTGSTTVYGTISKGSGTFMIDHPLDPVNKLLYHSFLESPDVKNLYDGIATLDRRGRVTIRLPKYFLALNKEFRYLASPMSEAMPKLHIKKGVRKKYWLWGPPVFTIAGGTPGGKISWQVTGIRKDRFIEENPIRVEVDKGADQPVDVGECIFPLLCER